MRQTRFVSVMLMTAIAAFPVLAQQGGRWNARSANVFRAEGVQGLTLPSTASPTAIVAQFLGERGRDAATVRSLALIAHGRPSDGVAHSRMEQRVNGLAVHGSYAKAAFNERGELVHLIENLAPAGRVATAAIDDRRVRRRRRERQRMHALTAVNICGARIPAAARLSQRRKHGEGHCQYAYSQSVLSQWVSW